MTAVRAITKDRHVLTSSTYRLVSVNTHLREELKGPSEWFKTDEWLKERTDAQEKYVLAIRAELDEQINELDEQIKMVLQKALARQEAQIRKRMAATSYFFSAFLLFSTITLLFFALGLVWLTTGDAVVHPFLIVVGILGGIGLLVTVWIDIHELTSMKRAKLVKGAEEIF